MKRLSFSKSSRLVSNRQFKNVLAHGTKVSEGMLMLCIAENDCGCSRLGVSISKSYGRAVARNRLKRLLREAFRQNQDQVPTGFDYLIMISTEWLKRRGEQAGAGNTVVQPTFEQIKASFLALVADAESLIKNRKEGG